MKHMATAKILDSAKILPEARFKPSLRQSENISAFTPFALSYFICTSLRAALRMHQLQNRFLGEAESRIQERKYDLGHGI